VVGLEILSLLVVGIGVESIMSGLSVSLSCSTVVCEANFLEVLELPSLCDFVLEGGFGIVVFSKLLLRVWSAGVVSSVFSCGDLCNAFDGVNGDPSLLIWLT